MPYVLDGNIIQPGVPFVHDGYQYPGNWIECSTQAERDAIGMVWVQETMRPDDRFYWVEQNPDGTYTATPKDVDMVRDEMIVVNKRTAYSALAPTDWMVVRGADGKAIDPNIDAYRQSVRVASDDNEATLWACTTIEELAQFVPVWPAPPEAANAAAR